MTTDFSITALLDLAPEKTNVSSKQGRNDKDSTLEHSEVTGFLSRTETKLTSRNVSTGMRKTQNSSPSINLKELSHTEFTTIVIPKKSTKPRRKRTAFSNIQLHFLEQFFQKKAYPSSQERNFIGSILNIGSGQVKTWYQNRRTKMKKNKVFDFGDKCQETEKTSSVPTKNIFGVENTPQTHRLPLRSSSQAMTSMCDFQFDWRQPSFIASTLLHRHYEQPMLAPHLSIARVKTN